MLTLLSQPVPVLTLSYLSHYSFSGLSKQKYVFIYSSVFNETAGKSLVSTELIPKYCVSSNRLKVRDAGFTIALKLLLTF